MAHGRLHMPQMMLIEDCLSSSLKVKLLITGVDSNGPPSHQRLDNQVFSFIQLQANLEINVSTNKVLSG